MRKEEETAANELATPVPDNARSGVIGTCHIHPRSRSSDTPGPGAICVRREVCFTPARDAETSLTE